MSLLISAIALLPLSLNIMCKNTNNSHGLTICSNEITHNKSILVPFKLDSAQVQHLAENVIRTYCAMRGLPNELNELEEWGIYKVSEWGIKEEKDICVYVVHHKQRHEIIFKEGDASSKEQMSLLKQFQYLSSYGSPQIRIKAVVFSRENQYETLRITLKDGRALHDFTFMKTGTSKWSLIQSGIPSQ